MREGAVCMQEGPGKGKEGHADYVESDGSSELQHSIAHAQVSQNAPGPCTEVPRPGGFMHCREYDTGRRAYTISAGETKE